MEKEKKLAAQFIAKFFKHFPDLMEAALDRQLDLCEDEDVQVRLKSLIFMFHIYKNVNILDSSTRYKRTANFLQGLERKYTENQ